MTVDEAYRACARHAEAHYENFPVASRLLPARMRPHVAAVYAFARTADDVADEGHANTDTRLAQLAQWRTWLHASRTRPVTAGEPRAIFVAVRDTIDRCDVPESLFDDLLSAFEQDVRQCRYETWAEVLDYCCRSANPVGRLVLGIAGVRNETAARQSDAVCTALQLTNFWQDLGRDWRSGRLYVPANVLAAHGASISVLDRGVTDDPWRAVMNDVTERTRTLFSQGRGVCEVVRGRLRYELRATWAGGTRILARTHRIRQSSLKERPVLTRRDLAPIAAQVLLWRAWRRS